MSDPDKDALEAAIERSLAPYARILPAKTLAKMREEMREYATSHPYPVALARQLRPEAVQASHVTASDAAPVDAPAEPPAKTPLRRIKGAGGGGR